MIPDHDEAIKALAVLQAENENLREKVRIAVAALDQYASYWRADSSLKIVGKEAFDALEKIRSIP